MRSAAIALFLAVALGCGSKPDKKDDPKPPVDPKANPTPPTNPTPEDPKAAAQKFADDFLKAVKAKTVTADQLTAEFRKAVAPPLGANDEVKDYLDKWAAAVPDAVAVQLAGDVAFGSGRPNAAGRLLVRLAKEGGAWKADWLSNGLPTAFESAFSGDADTSGVIFAANTFFDLIARKEFATVAAAMTPKGRTAIAPVPLKKDIEAGRDYALSELRDKLVALHGATDKYELKKTSVIPNALTALAEVELSAGATKRVAILTLVKGARLGVWQVETFEVK